MEIQGLIDSLFPDFLEEVDFDSIAEKGGRTPDRNNFENTFYVTIWIGTIDAMQFAI